MLDCRLPKVLAIGPALTSLYNDAYVPLLGPRQDALGTPYLDLWAEAAGEIAPQIERAWAGEATYLNAARFVLDRGNGPEDAWFEYSISPVRDDDGRVNGILSQAHEITERKRIDDRLRDSEHRLRVLMEGIPQLVWRSCDKGLWTWASPQWLRYTGQTAAQVIGRGWMDAIHPDDREATQAAWEAARDHGELDVDQRVRRAADGHYLWHQARSNPVRSEGGRIVEWLGTTTDVQDLRSLQDRQTVLVAELQHRTRNLIAVVRSIASQTMDRTDDKGGNGAFRETFGNRLAALSRVQGLLSRSDQESITLGTLVGMELEALGTDTQGRISVSGPDVALPASAVQTLALALHELATNARKYGAFSSPDGHLDVLWRMLDDEGDPANRWLSLAWVETGLTLPVADDPPAGRGYGRQLIERALPYSLGAKTSFELGNGQLVCTIDLPLKRKPD